MSITATKAAKSFSDFLNRVHYNGETFTIERGGEAIAQLGPVAGARPGVTFSEWLTNLEGHAPDASFATDLEEIVRNQPLAEGDRWS